MGGRIGDTAGLRAGIARGVMYRAVVIMNVKPKAADLASAIISLWWRHHLLTFLGALSVASRAGLGTDDDRACYWR